jgi:hypothetical protein
MDYIAILTKQTNIETVLLVTVVISPKKMVLAQTSINILGWTISDGALLPDPRKVNTSQSFEVPTTTRALNSFLGYMNYFRAAIPLYAHISSPLDKIRNVKNISDVWTEEHTYTSI